MQDWTGGMGVDPTATANWSSATVTPLQPQSSPIDFSDNTPNPAHSPWNSHTAQVDGYGIDATTGCVTFEPDPGHPFETYKIGEQFLQNDQQGVEAFRTDAVSPLWDGESEGWHVVSSYAPSSAQSHDSPQSTDSSWSHVEASPPATASPQNERHSHIFSAYPDEPRASPNRGRQRPLTSQEKQEALVVRKAKACWACHLSKIKVNSLNMIVISQRN